MAELEQRYEDNAPGRFYVDSECICCGICSELAPNFFRESEDGGYNIVHNQPSSPAEIELAMEALEQCPAESIGENGALAKLPTA